VDYNVKTASNHKTSEIVRSLGVCASTAVIIDSMMGQSIFLVPSQVAADAGSVRRALTAWLFGGALVLLTAFCFAELGAALPQAGGEYVYLRRGLGPKWGFLFGWASALLQGPTAAATISAGLLRIAGFLVPSVNTPIFGWSIQDPFHAQPYHFTFTVARVWAAAAIAAATALNYFGVRTAGRFQILIAAVKVTAIILVAGLGLAMKNASGIPVNANNAATAYGGARAFLTALVPIMLAYNGFQYLTQTGGEIRDPQRTIPRAAILGVSAVVVLYWLMNVIYFRALGFSMVAHSQHVASDAAVRIVGPDGARWVTMIMILSALGSLHANFLARSRVLYAMARDGQFFHFVGRIQPTFRTPTNALFFHGFVSLVLVLTGTFEEIYSLGVFSIWIFVALTAISLIGLRRQEPTLPRPYRAWGYPWTPLIVAVVAFAMSANLWFVRPVRSSIGLAVILLGIPLFSRLQKRAADSPLAEAGPSLDET
jgi:basic amino acid/polyamine antiporter, APA family